MMQHRKLDRLMTPVERIARVAAAGLTSATSSVTKPSGAKSYDNADGTRTIIGNVANGESNPSYTMATHVGDVTAPGTPTGVTASSKSGVVVVEWDGTLTGGIPDDFYAVRVYLDGVELGILTGAGSVSSASLEGGTTHGVTATAEDDACLPDGTPAHNVSAPTTAISVTVSEGVESVAAIAQEALDVAEATGQHFWSDTDGIHVTEVTQDEWNDSGGASYHSGANSLWNSLGMLFRDGVTNLMAVLTSGVAIYDGLGNAASNIVASFTATGATIGRLAEGHAVFDSSGMHVYDGANSVFDATYSATDDGTETVEDATIGTSSGGYLSFSETTLAGASAPYKVTTYLSSLLSLARMWLEYTPTTAQIGLRARHQIGGGVGGTAAVTLTSDSSTFEGNVAINGTSVTANGIEIGKSTSTTATRGSAASSIGVNSVRRYGNVVSVTLAEIKLASSLSSGSTTGTVATVPTGYRPATNVYAAIGSTGAHGGSYARIATNGVVTIRNSSGSSIATSAQLCFTLSYVI